MLPKIRGSPPRTGMRRSGFYTNVPLYQATHIRNPLGQIEEVRNIHYETGRVFTRPGISYPVTEVTTLRKPNRNEPRPFEPLHAPELAPAGTVAGRGYRLYEF